MTKKEIIRIPPSYLNGSLFEFPTLCFHACVDYNHKESNEKIIYSWVYVSASNVQKSIYPKMGKYEEKKKKKTVAIALMMVVYLLDVFKELLFM